ncbi:MAG: mechanosensitive ion channel family protein [Chloroflexi bacterium]|nr:mechanosensitive ion channel family protein [Chloroflexota bacterium]
MDFEFNDINMDSLLARALQILLILVITYVVLFFAKRGIKKIVGARIQKPREESAKELEKRTKTLSSVLGGVVSAIVWVIALVMILSELGVDVTPLIAALGIASLALGFAAQNIIRDYLYGFFIVMEDWYRVGEVVTVSGLTGAVVDMNLRRTTLRDPSGTMHVVPNSNIALASNFAREWSRINLNIGVAYKENVNDVWRLLDEICQEFKNDPDWGPQMLTTPSVVRVDNLGDSAVELKIMGDIKPGQQWALTGELRKRIKNRFDQEQIEIPWPHTMVYFGNAQPSQENNY